jgi:general secretion pathway protein M
MIAALPTGPTGRMLAIGVTVLVIVVLWLGVASPLLALYQDRSDWLVQRSALADRMEALAASLPKLQAQAAAQADDTHPPSLMLEGASDALAAAALQETLEKAAASSGTSLSSAESVPVQIVGSVRRIGLKVNVSGAYRALIDFLVRIDQSEPPLLTDELQIEGSLNPGETDPQLQAFVTVYGFRAGDKPGGEKQAGEKPPGEKPTAENPS